MFCYHPPSLCQVKNVVYTAICKTCDENHKKTPNAKHPGKYIGETYRTLHERVREHKASLRRWESGSFMLKHWALKHPEMLAPPEFKFSVLKKHDSPLSRLIHEAVIIAKEATLNSKNEWGGYKIPRLVVEKSEEENKKEAALEEMNSNNEKFAMQNLRKRVDEQKTKTNSCFRSKRKEADMTGQLEAKVLTVSKRLRIAAPTPVTEPKKSGRRKLLPKTSMASIRLMNDWINSKKVTTSTPVKESSYQNLGVGISPRGVGVTPN